MSHGYTRGLPVDTDATLAADSDLLVPSQKAIKAYVDDARGDLDSPSYVTMATDGSLSNERVLTAGNHVTVTDGGAGSTVTLDWVHDIRKRVRFYSDFWGSYPFLSATANGGSASTTGAGLGDGNHIGVFDANTGTSGSNGYAYAYIATDHFQFGDSAMRYQAIAKVHTLSDGTDTFYVFLGFTDSRSAAAQTDGCYFRYTHSENSGNWTCVTESNTTETTTDSGVAADTSYHAFEVKVNAAATSVTFYIDGSLVATHTTNIPSGAARQTGAHSGILKTVGTANRRLWVDAMLVEADVSR